ncbi:MAG: sporulation protein [Bacillaceae bacterium]|uniref:DUF1360 domain-containing protein n=1 Tax=Aeribacillus composti TaxID=1868734 RepID=A0ABY9WDD5_9BACI|nr:DUF1360 domain-containing protein [Aeribacillus composti]REJ21157.1 MAG: sporulation protein [Bacillaceae bacterium]BBU38790.1 membrane protein [Aeribacillus pallidus]MED0704061.1 DUF1360 domain-containing protein [Aeribacillus composti]MED1442773.1 DUF1360 domain-containing protein [Aeribacillus composti]WNF34136.1 DUF1360 domain-containing protein [Aeribacillus composti]
MEWHWFSFALIALATFRLTRIIVFDKIASFLRAPFITIVEEKAETGETVSFFRPKGKGLRLWIGELLSCYWCTGIWCAAILFFGNEYINGIFYPITVILAISGLAGIIEHLLD